MPCGPVVSPVRPSFLPVLEPVPVPTMKDAYMQMTSQTDKKDEPHTPNKTVVNSNVPRSQPISMKRSETRPIQNDIDISSLSPPSVSFPNSPNP
jgi:serine/threonine-protein kinase ULK/ATG1